MGSKPKQADIIAYNAWAKRNGEEPHRMKVDSKGLKEQILEELRALAKDRNIRDARKLYQMAKAQEMRDVTQALAKEGLESSVARQVLAPGACRASRPASAASAATLPASLRPGWLP
jgi:hypothetical protein